MGWSKPLKEPWRSWYHAVRSSPQIWHFHFWAFWPVDAAHPVIKWCIIPFNCYMMLYIPLINPSGPSYWTHLHQLRQRFLAILGLCFLITKAGSPRRQSHPRYPDNLQWKTPRIHGKIDGFWLRCSRKLQWSPGFFTWKRFLVAGHGHGHGASRKRRDSPGFQGFKICWFPQWSQHRCWSALPPSFDT